MSSALLQYKETSRDEVMLDVCTYGSAERNCDMCTKNGSDSLTY